MGEWEKKGREKIGWEEDGRRDWDWEEEYRKGREE
jgi:hypothetical protein